MQGCNNFFKIELTGKSLVNSCEGVPLPVTGAFWIKQSIFLILRTRLRRFHGKQSCSNICVGFVFPYVIIENVNYHKENVFWLH